MEGNVVAFTNTNSEEECDFQASFAIKESIRKNDVKVTASRAEELKQESTLVITSNKFINYQDGWIVDSGCSNYMTGDMNKLQSMTQYKGDRVIATETTLKCRSSI